MNLLQYQEAMNNKISDLQIWNNAAFDNGESEDTSAIKSSLFPKNSIFDSFDIGSSKENHTPVFPINSNPKQGIGEKSILKSSTEELVLKKIDLEVEEIEKEIKRLSCRLEVLRREKAEFNLKMIERRGRVVSAKFMEQKLSEKTKARKRGFSLGPSEIVAGAKSGQFGKQEITQITPVQSIKSRRKSCFWKLQGIEEENEIKERRKSLNLSPKSRKPPCRAQISRQAVTTVGLRKSLKKEDGVLQSIQPKKLFKDGEKSVVAKKTKPGRVIASRYNQSNGKSTANSAIRKRSLPENDKDESKRSDRKRASLNEKSLVVLPDTSQSMEDSVSLNEKSLVVLPDISQSMEDSVMVDMLPKIRTIGCINETPRDSGPAKKVAELIGTRSYFCSDEVAESFICQELSFEEDCCEEK